MQISFTLDWASFWIGSVSTVVIAFLGAFIGAAVQLRKSKKKW